MGFNTFQRELTAHIDASMGGESVLFTLNADPKVMWELYLESFPLNYNGVFRERRVHDCNACSLFIKRFGNVVSIIANTVTTMWDFEPRASAAEFGPSVKALREYLSTCEVEGVFLAPTYKLGTASNKELSDGGVVTTWDHLHARLPALATHREAEIPSLQGEMRADYDVFTRSLGELSLDATQTVIELIEASNLYKGEESLETLRLFRELTVEYWSIRDAQQRKLWARKPATFLPRSITRLRNHSIGTLLVDISSGTPLSDAVKKYEKMVAPENYKRPKGVFTARQVKNAEAKVVELGISDSLGRRFAQMSDISVNDILFANRDAAGEIKGGVLGSLLEDAKPTAPIKMDRLSEVPVNKFIEEVLPNATSVEVYLRNELEPNMVSLIAPSNASAVPFFKWGNGFSWAYNGNITDSSMKSRVKALGGNVAGDLRFSIQWNEEGDNQNDFDAHCREPKGGVLISFPKKAQRQVSSGMLDVDIQEPGSSVAVENIVYTDKSRMPHGDYTFLVHNYAHNGGRSGFRAEVESGGEIFSFNYSRDIRQNGKVIVADVNWDGKSFTIKPRLDAQASNKSVWGAKTGGFHAVTLAMLSPNHWNGADASGHKHLFLMLKGCTNPTTPNGFFNEFLPNSLMEHKQVFEALGGKMRVEPSENQLSGIGLSLTKPNYFVCRVGGASTRTMKVMV